MGTGCGLCVECAEEESDNFGVVDLPEEVEEGSSVVSGNSEGEDSDDEPISKRYRRTNL